MLRRPTILQAIGTYLSASNQPRLPLRDSWMISDEPAKVNLISPFIAPLALPPPLPLFDRTPDKVRPSPSKPLHITPLALAPLKREAVAAKRASATLKPLFNITREEPDSLDFLMKKLHGEGPRQEKIVFQQQSDAKQSTNLSVVSDAPSFSPYDASSPPLVHLSGSTQYSPDAHKLKAHRRSSSLPPERSMVAPQSLIAGNAAELHPPSHASKFSSIPSPYRSSSAPPPDRTSVTLQLSSSGDSSSDAKAKATSERAVEVSGQPDTRKWASHLKSTFIGQKSTLLQGPAAATGVTDAPARSRVTSSPLAPSERSSSEPPLDSSPISLNPARPSSAPQLFAPESMPPSRSYYFFGITFNKNKK